MYARFAMCAPDCKERRIEASFLHGVENVGDLAIELELDAHVEDSLHLASSTSRGSRYCGMPKRIMPPARGPASTIFTRWPRRRRWYAAESPEGPAPTTSTRLPLSRSGGANFQPSLIASSPRKALDRVDADRLVELAAVARGLAGVIADAPHDRGQRIVLGQLAPGGFVVARLRVIEPALMFSPAGHAWLHGGSRSTYSGRLVRHAPVLLARTRADVEGDCVRLVHESPYCTKPYSSMFWSAII
jgi:hypothetical protein